MNREDTVKTQRYVFFLLTTYVIKVLLPSSYVQRRKSKLTTVSLKVSMLCSLRLHSIDLSIIHGFTAMQIDATLIHRYIIINSGLLIMQNKAIAGSFPSTDTPYSF